MESPEENIIKEALRKPINSDSFEQCIKNNHAKTFLIVVSDITRPIPYTRILPLMLEIMNRVGVKDDQITLLIATGMHRPSRLDERTSMFGESICQRLKIVDHNAEDIESLSTLKQQSWSGNNIELNKLYLNSDFRIITGLVEPHFMAGFSGGRKAICPGLSSLKTVQRFHGFKMLNDPNAKSATLDNNPCHMESLSVAKVAGAEFCINVVLDNERNVIHCQTGDFIQSHIKTCEFVQKYSCSQLQTEYDLVLTSSGGAPLDRTFYQCVKGLVTSLPALKKRGKLAAIGGCEEGIGGIEYQEKMFKYQNRWQDFIKDIQTHELIKDQWQFQMQCRVLEHIGQENLLFFSPGLEQNILDQLSITGFAQSIEQCQASLQSIIDQAVKENKKIAAFPEGPYGIPLR